MKRRLINAMPFSGHLKANVCDDSAMIILVGLPVQTEFEQGAGST